MTDFNTILVEGQNVSKSNLANALNDTANVVAVIDSWGAVGTTNLTGTKTLIANNTVYFLSDKYPNSNNAREGIMAVDSVGNKFMNHHHQYNHEEFSSISVYIDPNGVTDPVDPIGNSDPFDLLSSAFMWLQDHFSPEERRSTTLTIYINDGTYTETFAGNLYITDWYFCYIYEASFNKTLVTYNFSEVLALRFIKCGNLSLYAITFVWPDTTDKTGNRIYTQESVFAYHALCDFKNFQSISFYACFNVVLQTCDYIWDQEDTITRSFGIQIYYATYALLDELDFTNISSSHASLPYEGVAPMAIGSGTIAKLTGPWVFESCFNPFYCGNIAKVVSHPDFSLNIANTAITPNCIVLVSDSTWDWQPNTSITISGANNQIFLSNQGEFKNAPFSDTNWSTNITPGIRAGDGAFISNASSTLYSSDKIGKLDVASLPSANNYEGQFIYLTDQKVAAFSNGTNWLYTADNTVVA